MPGEQRFADEMHSLATSTQRDSMYGPVRIHPPPPLFRFEESSTPTSENIAPDSTNILSRASFLPLHNRYQSVKQLYISLIITF